MSTTITRSDVRAQQSVDPTWLRDDSLTPGDLPDGIAELTGEILDLLDELVVALDETADRTLQHVAEAWAVRRDLR